MFRATEFAERATEVYQTSRRHVAEDCSEHSLHVPGPLLCLSSFCSFLPARIMEAPSCYSRLNLRFCLWEGGSRHLLFCNSAWHCMSIICPSDFWELAAASCSLFYHSIQSSTHNSYVSQVWVWSDARSASALRTWYTLRHIKQTSPLFVGVVMRLKKIIYIENVKSIRVIDKKLF
jgi:hypothetical protein